MSLLLLVIPGRPRVEIYCVFSKVKLCRGDSPFTILAFSFRAVNGLHMIPHKAELLMSLFLYADTADRVIG